MNATMMSVVMVSSYIVQLQYSCFVICANICVYTNAYFNTITYTDVYIETPYRFDVVLGFT